MNVASEEPGDWRDVTVPGPFGVLRVTVLARSLDDAQRFRIDFASYVKPPENELRLLPISASSQGKASAAPAPRRTVRRDRCF